MKFKDAIVYKNERFSVGVEEEAGKYYLSIPVSNNLVDYEEYYDINKEEFDRFSSSVEDAAEFVQQCRSRQRDDRLMVRPGNDRGTAI
ncbi:hypothetical protein [Solimicrobium silvestre]|uniref:Uncharacterized protein n=1 Tax=Solimicrobium silvestre TaxID=2099400 RepID=A0A2S9GT63_9BURK|nr:hypothetical protein [Solimicrobium silvestre]PRC90886.1 hypothetical protein S2091_4379 [Solimicrobium silvestre]